MFNKFKFDPKRVKKGETGFTFCSATSTINVFGIYGFPGNLINEVLTEVLQCFSQFDQNDAPIVVTVNKNTGGHTLLVNAILYWLMPNRAIAGVSAVRKTPTNKALGIDAGMIFDQSVMCNGCKDINNKTAEAWWSPDFVDDYGNGIKHTRTDKGTISYARTIKKLSDYVMKNVRKPTDIIVVTDGFCYSACAYFAHNIAETGGAIFAGAGPYNPDSEIFPGSQCPSKFVGIGTYVPGLIPASKKYGVNMRVTYAESYPFPVEPTDLYPRDFVPSYIDVNLHTYSATASLNDLLLAAYNVWNDFKTHCNPKNKRLVLVNNECTVNDPNALDVGFACGDDGVWNKNKCVISTCKKGYAVDFINNVCVKQYCDPRDDI